MKRGLEYIAFLYNVSFTEIANRVGVSKQTVNSWVKGRRPIADKHLPKLSEMFDNIPKEYFEKELSEIDKLKIQRIKQENNIQQVLQVYTDSRTGEEIGEEMVDDPKQVEYMEHLEYEIRLKEYENKFHKYLNKSTANDIQEQLYESEDKLNIFNKLLTILNSGIDRKIINYVLEGIRNYEIKEESDNTLIKSVTNAINDYVKIQKGEAEELVNMLKEMGYSEDEILKKDTDK